MSRARYDGQAVYMGAIVLLAQRLPGNRAQVGEVHDGELEKFAELAERQLKIVMRREGQHEEREILAGGGLKISKCSACGEDHLIDARSIQPKPDRQVLGAKMADGGREFFCPTTGKPVTITTT